MKDVTSFYICNHLHIICYTGLAMTMPLTSPESTDKNIEVIRLCLTFRCHKIPFSLNKLDVDLVSSSVVWENFNVCAIIRWEM